MRPCALVLILASVTAAADTDPYASSREPIGRIVARSYDGNALAQLTELGDSIGPRLSGTAAYTKAVDWGVSQLRAAGARNVHVEKLSIEHGWQRGTARAAITAPSAWTLHVASLGWSPSTDKVVRGPVVRITNIDALPAQLDGKIVVIARTALDGPNRWIRERKALETMTSRRALAVLYEGNRANNVLGATAPLTSGKLSPLPAGIVGKEDAALLERLDARGAVTLELEIVNTITGPVEVANVVGELTGVKGSDEWVLVGAHLDSWDLATGSSDNGSGVVQVIQAARALAAVAPLPRTIRFALWAAEEQFVVGSHAYATAHAADLANCVAVLNTDSGAGHVRGWRVQGRTDVKDALTPIATSLLASLGGGLVDPTFDPIGMGSDHVSFLAEGVPALDLSVDETIYDELHHKLADTVDKVDAHALASGVAVIAVTAYAIASAKKRFAVHLDRPTVEAMFKPSGFDAVMRYERWWK